MVVGLFMRCRRYNWCESVTDHAFFKRVCVAVMGEQIEVKVAHKNNIVACS